MNIKDFENAVGTLPTQKDNIWDTCIQYLKGFLNTNIGFYNDNTGTENMIIVDSENPLPRAEFELMGQICKINNIDHFIYYDNKNGFIYNDVEIRENKDLLYICEKRKLSLYRKKGQTYRDLLKDIFLLTDDDIKNTQAGNKTINFVETFVSKDDSEKSKMLKNFIVQYLADKSRFELERLIRTPFSGNVFRHGICNYSGDLSYFMAGMQMLYDCVLFTYGKAFTANALTNTDATTKMFEFQLLNLEYCLRRIFENIQTTIDNGQKENFDPLALMTTPVSGEPSENVFYNYMLCINFILAANPLINISLGANHQGVNNFPEYNQQTVLDNYYYSKVGKNLFNYEELQRNATTTAETTTVGNPWWYPGKFIDMILLGPRIGMHMHTFHEDEETALIELDIEDTELEKLRKMATDEEKNKEAKKLLSEALKKKLQEI